MRYLVLGAGSLGGYFGSMLLKGGADVTFWSGPNARPYFNATAWS
jgi:2-dehydropantoate 2-reductase